MKKLLISLLSILGFCCGCSAESIPDVKPAAFARMVKADTAAVVLDVRTPQEFDEGHLKGALLLDVKDSEAFDKGIATLDKNKHYYVYCRSGRRSMKACEIMKKKGFSVTNLDGGIIAWEKEKLPVVK